MRPDLAARTAGLEWAHRQAAGALDDLSWVDSNLDPNIPIYSQTEDQEEGLRRFSHLPYAAFLPSLLANAAIHAQARKQAPMAEALLLLFASSEWMVYNRARLWSPLSPVPQLLATLVEAFGVGQDLHRDQPEVLARLAAQLPTWHPWRGTVARAREVLENTGDLSQADGAMTLESEGPTPESLLQEVFVCRDESWWEARAQPESTCSFRIDGGVLKFQPKSKEQRFTLRREDLLLRWNLSKPLPRQLLRLLPTWVVLRLVLPSESRK